MANYGVTLFILSAVLGTVLTHPPPSAKDENPECRPPPPAPGTVKEQEACCDLPHLDYDKESPKPQAAYQTCREDYKASHPQPGPGEPEEPPSPPPPPGEAAADGSTTTPASTPPAAEGSPQPPPKKRLHHLRFEGWECIDECVFNKTGLLTQESKLNSDAILVKVNEMFAKDEKWKDLTAAAVKKCLESAPNDVREKSECKSGAHQFTRCVLREAFLNCPADKWKSNEVCNQEKARLEKCPKHIPLRHLLPRPPTKEKN